MGETLTETAINKEHSLVPSPVSPRCPLTEEPSREQPVKRKSEGGNSGLRDNTFTTSTLPFVLLSQMSPVTLVLSEKDQLSLLKLVYESRVILPQGVGGCGACFGSAQLLKTTPGFNVSRNRGMGFPSL